MKVLIDFKRREIHFNEDTSIDEMASCMNNHFPEDTWGDFKFIIDGGIDEKGDIGQEFDYPIGDG